MKYPPSVLAGVAVTAALGLWGAIAGYGFERDYWRMFSDPFYIRMYAGRLEGVPALAPPDAVMGYLSDPETAGDTLLPGAQYVLAPRLLERGANHEWVLGNFRVWGDFAAVGRQHGLRIVRDFGNGVVVYRKEAR